LLLRICLICSILVASAIPALPQVPARHRPVPRKATSRTQPKAQPTPRSTPEQNPEQQPQPSAEPSPVEEQQEVETVKVDTNLVTVPVIATTTDGTYVPDLRQEEFSIWENGEKQQAAFFATVSAPFHVVLLLDTSASTQEKLGLIQRAAATFVEQLQSRDRLKVISFDNEVRELSDFTNDRAVLKAAIYKTASGRGTKLYDAFELALNSVKTIQGRKAIVLFTDGVDYHSDAATFDSTLHWLDEEGVIVYPIRYETRDEAERIARDAGDDPMNRLPTIDVIRRAPSGTTAPTFPSDDSGTVPSSGQRPRNGPLGLPTVAEIMRGRRQRDPNTDRLPAPDRPPPTTGPADPREGSPVPGDGRSDPRDRTRPSGRGSPRNDDSIKLMLDQLYLKADSYLMELANKSGGRLLRADTLASLPDAFAKIAAELRTQYSIGYYPSDKTRDGQYRKIKVASTRKNVVVRARPGYRAPSGG
jgi:Mg-chelatase subunit ChlD